MSEILWSIMLISSGFLFGAGLAKREPALLVLSLLYVGIGALMLNMAETMAWAVAGGR